jgi:hypothetical protein
MRRVALLLLVVVSACGASEVEMQTGGGGGGVGDGGGGGGGGANAGCGYSNCQGCCFNGACQTGTTDAACGRNGTVCQMCVTGTACSMDQTCVINPATTWKVLPVSGVVATMNMGGSWDPLSGAPDPYVTLWCPASAAMVTAKTPTANDTFTPGWGDTMGSCIMSAGDLETVGFAVEVDDEDLTTPDNIFAKAVVKPSDADLLAGFMIVSDTGSLMSLRLALLKQ